jgi:hypothetical protein
MNVEEITSYWREKSIGKFPSVSPICILWILLELHHFNSFIFHFNSATLKNLYWVPQLYLILIFYLYLIWIVKNQRRIILFYFQIYSSFVAFWRHNHDNCRMLMTVVECFSSTMVNVWYVNGHAGGFQQNNLHWGCSNC